MLKWFSIHQADFNIEIQTHKMTYNIYLWECRENSTIALW